MDLGVVGHTTTGKGEQAMTIETDAHRILELMERPAFCVLDGIIVDANEDALRRLIPLGEPIGSLLPEPKLYQPGAEGQQTVELRLGEQLCPARVTPLGQMDLFSLEPEQKEPVLRAYALAAQTLRQPLSQALAVSDQILPQLHLANPAKDQMSLLNRSLHQLLRIVGNMSDAGAVGSLRTELVDVTAFIQEWMDRVMTLWEQDTVRLCFENHPAAIYSLVDGPKLERAMYNLLSNARKHTPPGGTIGVVLKRRGNHLILSVTNSTADHSPWASADAFSRFLREPGVEDGSKGLGLGMELVHSIATAHGGTLLLDRTREGDARVTLTLPIRQTGSTLRNNPMRIDYAGERDHSLIELSEFLPGTCYDRTKD